MKARKTVVMKNPLAQGCGEQPPVLPTPGKIIRPGHQKNSAAGRKNLLPIRNVLYVHVNNYEL